jgi:hypothetical protein
MLSPDQFPVGEYAATVTSQSLLSASPSDTMDTKNKKAAARFYRTAYSVQGLTFKSARTYFIF